MKNYYDEESISYKTKDNDDLTSNEENINMNTIKVFVIGMGRFGTATAQGLRESFYKKGDDGAAELTPLEVVHVSATEFTSHATATMAEQLQNSKYVVYCGTRLPKYSAKLAQAMKRARQYSDEDMEFIDFSNPDPINEKNDLSGALDLWMALGMYTNVSSKSLANWTVWKITEVGSLDIAGTEGTSRGIVYKAGASTDKVPMLKMPNLTLVPAPEESNDLYDEARQRIMERSEIDRWYDGMLVGFAVFLFTSVYAIVRYNVNFNGSEPTEQIPMYLLDKSYGWTGLWMMVVSPFAGNLLAIGSLCGRFGQLPIMDKMVTILSIIFMSIPTIFYFFAYVAWIVLRNIFFSARGGVSGLYQVQFSKEKSQAFVKSTLIDMVTLKGETGCVGFAYALIHSFLGIICADVAYKGYWFNEINGRMHWNMELSMMTGCVSTVLLCAVAMRSLMGKASWIRLKPLYAYASPIGMWFAVVHVMAFGAKGWTKLFKKEYHNGQLSITFVSSMFPTGVLLTHHLMQTFGTKRHISDLHLWRHSMTSIATKDFNNLRRNVNNKADMISWVKDYVGGRTVSSSKLIVGRPQAPMNTSLAA